MDKQDLQRVCGALEKGAQLLGEKDACKTAAYGFTPGLGHHSYAMSYRALCQQILDGLFMFLTMGEFSTGKSTLINTMLNENVLATKITPATGVIAQIENGEPGLVKIFYEQDGQSTRRPAQEISEGEFFSMFTLTPEDAEECETTGCIRRFENVRYAVIRRRCAMLEDGVRLVDSPGLNESISQNKTTEQFLPHANAVIFVMSALEAFKLGEKRYIDANFAGKGRRNVFFVFTRADNTSYDQLELLKTQVRKELKKVFLRKDGTFDEELFANRVFYVDALHSGQLRIEGNAYDIDRRGNCRPLPDLTLEDTEIPQLEQAIKTFLSSDQRTVEQYQSLMGQAASAYVAAQQASQKTYESSLLPLEELDKNIADAKAELAKATVNLENIRRSFKSYAEILYTKLDGNMRTVQDKIDRDWPAFVEGAPHLGRMSVIARGLGNIVHIIPIDASRKAVEKAMKDSFSKYTDYAQPFFEEHLAELKTLHTESVQTICEDLRQAVGVQVDMIAQLVDTADDLFRGSGKTRELKDMSAGDVFKTLVNIMNFDPAEAAMSSNGQQSWGDFFTGMVGHTAVEIGIIMASGPFAPLALGGMIVYHIFRLGKAGKKMAETDMGLVKQGFDEHVKNEFTVLKDALPQKISRTFTPAEDKLVESITREIEAIKAQMDKALSDRKEVGFNAEERKKNDEKNLSALKDCLGAIHTVLFGTELTDDGIRQAAQHSLRSVSD
ncbi:hypothetical protein SDC9_52650 [bioreactor metagenome]|uniref:Dynamin N-terminal domain-containing protein n=1 Tax=bioreactor metagenome TaxID=1076179 RepID=A0A644WS61_9ZZZZ